MALIGRYTTPEGVEIAEAYLRVVYAGGSGKLEVGAEVYASAAARAAGRDPLILLSLGGVLVPPGGDAAALAYAAARDRLPGRVADLRDA